MRPTFLIYLVLCSTIVVEYPIHPIGNPMCGISRNVNSTPNTGRSLVVIRPISSPSHPALGQCGLFATKKIPPKTFIINYIGEIHCNDRPESDYDLSLYRSRDGFHVGIDASAMGNEARYINDYRGIRSKPNAIFSDAETASGGMRMSIWSSEEIKKGEEILVSYGKSWWQARRPA